MVEQETSQGVRKFVPPFRVALHQVRLQSFNMEDSSYHNRVLLFFVATNLVRKPRLPNRWMLEYHGATNPFGQTFGKIGAENSGAIMAEVKWPTTNPVISTAGSAIYSA